MDMKVLVIAAIALLLGVGGGYALAERGGMHAGETREEHAAHTQEGESHMHEEMEAMMSHLEGKTGDQFDQAFLEEMIMHHEGAIAMAEAALRDAGHTEIKELANIIINTQTEEIAQMRAWLSSWYGQ